MPGKWYAKFIGILMNSPNFVRFRLDEGNISKLTQHLLTLHLQGTTFNPWWFVWIVYFSQYKKVKMDTEDSCQ